MKTIVPEELANYVTKLSTAAEHTARQIEESVIYYPIPQCQSVNQFFLVDTPGLNDDVEMTAITLRGLRSCDVAIMLIMADSPFSQSEESFLHDYLLNSHVGQLIFVVNGIDRLRNANDVKRVLNLVETRINASILKWIEKQGSDKTEIYLRKYGKPKVFPISALQALQAKQQANATLLQTSGFVAFEQELVRVFNQECLGILSQVAVNQTLSAANTMLTRISQDLPLLASSQNQEHQLHELLSTELDKVGQYLSRFNDILGNLKKDSQQLGDNFKDELITSVENKIDSTVDEFFAGKEIASLLFFSQSIGGLCTKVTSSTSETIATVVNDSSDVQLQFEYNELLPGKDALKDWALELFEDITLRFTPKLESAELENLHRTAADTLHKVTEFRGNSQSSSISLVPHYSGQSVFSGNLSVILIEVGKIIFSSSGSEVPFATSDDLLVLGTHCTFWGGAILIGSGPNGGLLVVTGAFLVVFGISLIIGSFIYSVGNYKENKVTEIIISRCKFELRKL